MQGAANCDTDRASLRLTARRSNAPTKSDLDRKARLSALFDHIFTSRMLKDGEGIFQPLQWFETPSGDPRPAVHEAISGGLPAHEAGKFVSQLLVRHCRSLVPANEHAKQKNPASGGLNVLKTAKACLTHWKAVFSNALQVRW
jgi:hypothetical protein